MNAARERSVLVRLAFVDSLPVLMGYATMGFVAGALLAAKGDIAYAPLWALLTAFFWVTGTMSIAFVPLVAAREPLTALIAMTLAVNFRYAFYGFSMLGRWRDVPLLRKCYLILMLTDENYALEAASPIRSSKNHLTYCTLLSAMNHSYWIVGVTGGAIVVALLGHVFDAESIRRWTNGMDFSMTALFLVIFTDQMREFLAHGR